MHQRNSAKYLLRFDDLCPTMNWNTWSEIQGLLEQNQVHPILSVVPDNQDPALQVESPVRDFWDRARDWQQRGWTIGLHGYQHRYVSPNAGLVAVRKKSEFAGLPLEQQEKKLRCALEIFRNEGVQPRVWIAPGNTFDRVTVSLLGQFGIRVICDGYFRFPYTDAVNMTWIPHQLFSFRPAPPGVWTICYHHNNWTSADLERFRSDLEGYGPQIWSVEDVLARYSNRSSYWSARFCSSPRISRWVIRVWLKVWSYRGAPVRVEPRAPDASRIASV